MTPTQKAFRLINAKRSYCLRIAIAVLNAPQNHKRDEAYKEIKQIVKRMGERKEHTCVHGIAIGSLCANQFRYGKWNMIPSSEATSCEYYRWKDFERKTPELINPDEKADLEAKQEQAARFNRRIPPAKATDYIERTRNKRAMTDELERQINSSLVYRRRLRQAAGINADKRHDFEKVVYEIISQMGKSLETLELKLYPRSLAARLWKRGEWKKLIYSQAKGNEMALGETTIKSAEQRSQLKRAETRRLEAEFDSVPELKRRLKKAAGPMRGDRGAVYKLIGQIVQDELGIKTQDVYMGSLKMHIWKDGLWKEYSDTDTGKTMCTKDDMNRLYDVVTKILDEIQAEKSKPETASFDYVRKDKDGNLHTGEFKSSGTLRDQYLEHCSKYWPLPTLLPHQKALWNDEAWKKLYTGHWHTKDNNVRFKPHGVDIVHDEVSLFITPKQQDDLDRLHGHHREGTRLLHEMDLSEIEQRMAAAFNMKEIKGLTEGLHFDKGLFTKAYGGGLSSQCYARASRPYLPPKNEEYPMDIKTQTLINGAPVDGMSNSDLIHHISNLEALIASRSKMQTKSKHIEKEIATAREQCAQLAEFLDSRSDS